MVSGCMLPESDNTTQRRKVWELFALDQHSKSRPDTLEEFLTCRKRNRRDNQMGRKYPCNFALPDNPAEPMTRADNISRPRTVFGQTTQLGSSNRNRILLHCTRLQ